MKKYFIYSMFFVCCVSCSQNKEQIKDTNMGITANNIVAKTVQQVQHYPKEPIYYLYVANSLCVYEILVNDLPVHQNYKYEQLATPIYINRAILKSGRQKITYRLYPAPKEFNGGSDVFDSDTQFDVTVYQQDFKRPDADTEVLVKEEKLPIKKIQVGDKESQTKEEFVAKGQKYYEYSFYFDAEVPYENEGWSNGEDLRKIDQDLLKQWVVKFYNLRKKTVEENNKDALARQVFEGLKEQFVSEYQERDYIKDAWNEFITKYDNPTYQLQPFENYKMEFFGDGRLVCLRQISNDARYREKSALFGKYKDENGNTRADFHRLYLYLPKGEGLEYIQMIR
ncbi:hypothetical protein FNW52_05610 [Flavobacterium sp. ZT3R18]|uniref:hypothetical protein n=1 Tax=Flavobacterium sp. ZT3R18 TaxID=2594429 RepID=UPI00117B2AF2|nr:hypothetical protein [Flavobacterium sp. ZT3R18]TRX37438.1 hypothetical protein FNW52_05610 [Flavobacterium sp. ZT3R18]